MIIDFQTVLKNWEGKNYKTREVKEDEKGEPQEIKRDMLLADLAVEAILSPVYFDKDGNQKTQNLPAKERIDRDHLAKKIYFGKKPIAVTADQIKLIKDCIEKTNLNTSLFVAAVAILDPDSLPKEEKEASLEVVKDAE